MSWIDVKYIGQLSSRLRNFKQKNTDLWQFSCPFCNDSKTKIKKARGYIYSKDNTHIYHCHNCGITHKFSNFLKQIDENLYDEYLIEFLDKKPKKTDQYKEIKKKYIEDYNNPFKGLKKVSQLPINHPCKIYIEKRKIPPEFHYKLYWVPKFMQWTNQLIPGKFDEKALRYDEGRLLIPFFNKEGKFHAFQGRSLKSNSECKYITIVLDETIPKIYGLDKVCEFKQYYVLEGPIDTLYLPNAIATAGGDLCAAIKYLNKENAIICYDNESRSIETINKIQKSISLGLKVCIWPSEFMYKDISDMYCNGLTTDNIVDIIKNNTFQGLEAELKLNFWCKVK